MSQGSHVQIPQGHGTQTHSTQTHTAHVQGTPAPGNQVHGNQLHSTQTHGMQTHGIQTHGTQELGELFRQRRAELSLSLKEIENATSIRTSYLQAIEDGQTEKLISPIYAQGFVRQYAAFLGLDGDSIIAEHADIFKRPIQQDFAYGIGTLETRGSPGGGIKWLPNALWLIATLFVGIVAYFVAKSLSLL